MTEVRKGILNKLAHEYMFWLRRLVIHRLEVERRDANTIVGGAVVVANHPNGLIDGAVVQETSPRIAAVLSKKPLFSTPIVGQILKAMNAKPVVRKQDGVSGDNTKLFTEVHEHLNSGGAITVFPEGISHDEPRIMPLKTGAARMALDGNAQWIIPGGIHYEQKGVIQTDALVRYGVPLPISSDDTVASLTTRIHTALEEIVVTCPDRRLYDAVTRAVHIGLPGSLASRVRAIEALLTKAQGLPQDESSILVQRLEAIATLRWRVTDGLSKRELIRFALLAGPALIGWFSSLPIERFIAWLAKRHSTDPDLLPSIKILGANVFYPILWLLGGGSLAISHSATAGLCFCVGWPIILWARLQITRPLRRLVGTLYRWRQLKTEAHWEHEFIWLGAVSQCPVTHPTKVP
jgi:1-acyl-sn-glycerol-3-phosphate acyltransferase